MANEPQLDEEQRRFVVTSLACFDTPTMVSRALKEAYGVEITRQSIERYDHTKHRGTKDPGDIALFDRARAEFLESQAAIGISHKVVRLRYLQRIAEQLVERGAFKLAMEALEQAAKETGGSYTNKVMLDANHTVDVVSKEQRDAAVAAAIRADR